MDLNNKDIQAIRILQDLVTLRKMQWFDDFNDSRMIQIAIQDIERGISHYIELFTNLAEQAYLD